MVRQTHPALLFRTREPPGTRNRPPSRIQFHPDHSTMFRTLLTYTPVPFPQRSYRLLPTDLVLHQSLPEPPRPQITLLLPRGRTGERI